MSGYEALATLLLSVGGFFYLAGTVGLLRFPDAHSRLHALTKADNLGLFFVCTALAMLSGSLRVVLLLALIWLVALLAATVSTHLIARHATRVQGDGPTLVGNGPMAHDIRNRSASSEPLAASPVDAAAGPDTGPANREPT